MDDQYKYIYRLQYDTLEEPRFREMYAVAGEGEETKEEPLVPRIRQAIDAATRGLTPQLRSDAKFMLLLNFVNMIGAPLQIHGDSANYIEDGLQRDIRVIVEEAAREETARSSDISARALVNALTRSWSSLRLSDVGLWGA